jgi:hypothetical protein
VTMDGEWSGKQRCWRIWYAEMFPSLPVGVV